MFKRTKVGTGVLVALGGAASMLALPVAAQTVDRVEITGSAIKRIDAESALPVTVVRVEELSRMGVTTVEQAMARIASNQSNFGSSQAIGATTGGKAEADLRGLSAPFGSNANKTLVLLNGRRLANHSFDAAAVDLNAIPLAAIDRIEVLRDGASALYGTDAIAGVINFILKRDFSGGEISASYQRPSAGSAGETQRASIVAGFGSLSANRFNLMATLDWRSQKVMEAVDRPFGSTGILGSARADVTAGTSGTAYPGDVDGFEPSGPACDPPFSVPRFANADNTGAFDSCRYDFTRSIDLIPKNEQLTGLIRASFALTADTVLSAEYLNSQNKATSRVAPAPTSHLIPATSPFFPAGATPGSIADLNNPAGPNVAGGVVNWRQVPAGKRTSGDDTTTDRFLVDLEGVVAGIDYKAAVGRSTNKSTASVKRGYVNDSLMQDGVFNGVINPFGRHGDADLGQTAAGLAAIEAAQVVADTQIGKATVDFADFRGTMDLFKMTGGTAVIAFGIEARREKSAFEATDITAELGSLGIDPDSDTSGSRNSQAVFAELNLPIIKGLDLTLAARYDHYSDFGSTFNPKIGVIFRPSREVAVRGSYNTGFRAPTLYELNQPQSLTFTTDNYDDPVLCPGGVAAPGASAGAVCGQQVLKREVGPVSTGRPADSLDPEKSRAFSVGLVFEPMAGLSLSADIWQMKIKNLISGLPEQEVFASATKYAGRFVRCRSLPATGPGISQDDVDVCLNTAFDPIAYIDTPTENLGELHASGIDLGANWKSAPSGLGVFSAAIDGTYISKYRYQRERGGNFINAVGRYADNAPVFRWQHVLTLGWSAGPWGATLSQRYKTDYTDQGGAEEVDSYALHDLSVSYTGIKGLTVTAGISNLMDQDPPRTVQVTTFQRGYDPRFTDPLGRTYLVRAAYRF